MRNKRKQKRIIFISSILAISLLSVIFIINNFRDNIVFFYSPSEIKTTEVLNKIQNRQIRVGGLVKEDSILKIDASTTIFTITDLENDLEIFYQGIVPDLFRQGQGVVAKGKYDHTKKQFASQELLIKHDENYMPPEVKDSLKKSGSY
ncbi:MAG: cytochrome c maturation protein CcmE [Rickettsiales bacterium]|nr:cytochrome c maturation protein CcmE [Rickettsiales bacterium]